MVAEDSQFLIATHSPIILAFPEAEILSFDNGKIRKKNYDELEFAFQAQGFKGN